jgi:hypothetical protein
VRVFRAQPGAPDADRALVQIDVVPLEPLWAAGMRLISGVSESFEALRWRLPAVMPGSSGDAKIQEQAGQAAGGRSGTAGGHRPDLADVRDLGARMLMRDVVYSCLFAARPARLSQPTAAARCTAAPLRHLSHLSSDGEYTKSVRHPHVRPTGKHPRDR